jgi:hypothetical protein
MQHLDHNGHGCWLLAETALPKVMMLTHITRLLTGADCEHQIHLLDQWRRLLTPRGAYNWWGLSYGVNHSTLPLTQHPHTLF